MHTLSNGNLLSFSLMPRPNASQLRVDYISFVSRPNASQLRVDYVIHPQLRCIRSGHETTLAVAFVLELIGLPLHIFAVSTDLDRETSTAKPLH